MPCTLCKESRWCNKDRPHIITILSTNHQSRTIDRATTIKLCETGEKSWKSKKNYSNAQLTHFSPSFTAELYNRTRLEEKKNIIRIIQTTNNSSIRRRSTDLKRRIVLVILCFSATFLHQHRGLFFGGLFNWFFRLSGLLHILRLRE